VAAAAGEIYKSRFLPHLKPFPEVRPLLERMKRDGLRLIVATSSPEDEVKPGEDELILDGALDGHPTRAKLRKMALISKPFHWIFVAPKEDR